MTRIAAYLLLALMMLSTVAAGDDLVKGSYCYTYGDNESLKDAREITRAFAIREATESSWVYISSASKVENLQLTKDLVQSISSATLKNLQVIEHTEKDRTICDKIQASVNEKEISELMQKAKAELKPQIVNMDSRKPTKKLDSSRNNLSTAHAAGMPIEGLPIKIGDTVDDLQKVFGAKLEPQPVKSTSPIQRTAIRLKTKGIWAFFEKGKIVTLRVDPPFSGAILGVKLGDPLSRLQKTLGPAVKQGTFGTLDTYMYYFDDLTTTRFDVNREDGEIKTIYFIR